MGGNALSAPSIRLPLERYRAACGDVTERLARVFPGRRAMVIPAYAAKADFGDMAVLIVGGGGYDPTVAAAALNATEVVRNGDVTSLGVKVEEGVFQVDLIKVPAESFDFALRYFAMNDLGNLLGRIAHKAGFKLGHLGLLYPLRDQRNADHVIAELVVTRDWGLAIGLLGYDAKAYQDGFDGGFRSLSDIFSFVVSSQYCNRDIYLLENRNAKARVRDNKRPTYTAFLKWLECVPNNALPAYDWSDKEMARQTFLGGAMERFPGFATAYVDANAHQAVERMFRAKLNGQFVAAISGLTGRELGELMGRLNQQIREQCPDHESLRAWVTQTGDHALRLLVEKARQELYPHARADRPTA